MKNGPQDGKPEIDGPLGKSGNFTVVGYAGVDGTLLYRDDDTGSTYEDGQTLEEFGEKYLGDKEQGYLRLAAALNEHDVVRVLKDVESDGYAVKKGMTGAIVSVYNSGEAYSVEIPEIEDGPAVVTLQAGDVKLV